MSLPPGFLDELRGRVSLAGVVGRRVTWDARKTNPARGDYWAPCPFHQEKTASFHVDDAKGFYYCFGCQAKGDAITFLREAENLDFLAAIEVLAREAGLDMPRPDPQAAERRDLESRLGMALEAAVRFFRLQLGSGRGAEARAYLDRRGVEPATRDRFELGFAPDSRTALTEALTAKGIPLDDLVAAGLVIRPEQGAPYDRFRGRVMFPIRDARGRAIAFGGRALSPNAPAKYLNSPETPLFDKGGSLYNIGPARTAAARTRRLIVVEGYMDTIALTQAGIEDVVAPLGTAITEDQLDRLWRIAPEPVIALDGDAAGLRAAQRLIDLALPRLEAGRGLRFALMPDGQDPDDVVRGGGAAAFARLIETSRPMVDLIWTRATEGAPLDSPERRAALDTRLRALIETIRDPGLRAHYQAEFRTRRAALFTPPRPSKFGRSTEAPRRGRAGIAFHLGAVPPSAAARASALGRADPTGRAEARMRECAILAVCLNHPNLAVRFEERLGRSTFTCADLAEIRDALLSELSDSLDEGQVPLLTRISARVGRDALASVFAPGHVRVNPHLGPRAESEQAAQTLDEALSRHEASIMRPREVRDAELEMQNPSDEHFIWRLAEFVEDQKQLSPDPLADADGDGVDRKTLLESFHGSIHPDRWKKPKKR